MAQSNFQSLLLEFLGTFFITFSSSFSFTVLSNKQIDQNGMGLVSAFIIMIFTWMAKNITLAQFNPCITVLLVILKKLKVNLINSFLLESGTF